VLNIKEHFLAPIAESVQGNHSDTTTNNYSAPRNFTGMNRALVAHSVQVVGDSRLPRHLVQVDQRLVVSFPPLSVIHEDKSVPVPPKDLSKIISSQTTLPIVPSATANATTSHPPSTARCKAPFPALAFPIRTLRTAQVLTYSMKGKLLAMYSPVNQNEATTSTHQPLTHYSNPAELNPSQPNNPNIPIFWCWFGRRRYSFLLYSSSRIKFSIQFSRI
jgi:hypothetical protein